MSQNNRSRAIIFFVSLIAVCFGMSVCRATRIDEQTASIIEQYEPFSALARGCEIYSAKLKKVKDLTGRLYGPDEHIPMSFVGLDHAVNGPITFKKDYEPWGIIPSNRHVRISGFSLEGSMTCAGNGFAESFASAFLVDKIVPLD